MTKILKWEKFIPFNQRSKPQTPTPQKEQSFDEEDDIEFEDVNGQGGGIVFPFSLFAGGNSLLSERDLFIANTNFHLTADDVLALEGCHGVEAYKIVSKYCFTIAVGKMFDSAIVLLEIEKKLNVISDEIIDIEDFSSLEDKDVDEIVTKIKAVSDTSDYWAIYVFPNGRVFSKIYDSEEALEADKNMFEDLSEFSEGVFYFSHDS